MLLKYIRYRRQYYCQCQRYFYYTPLVLQHLSRVDKREVRQNKTPVRLLRFYILGFLSILEIPNLAHCYVYS